MYDRDYQRARVYAADDEFAVTSFGRVLIERDGLDQWLWHFSSLTRMPYRVRFSRRAKRAYAIFNGREILLPDRSNFAVYDLLHEVAHLVVHYHQRMPMRGPHGPEFVGVYVMLIRYELGRIAAEQYLSIAQKKGVDVVRPSFDMSSRLVNTLLADASATPFPDR